MGMFDFIMNSDKSDAEKAALLEQHAQNQTNAAAGAPLGVETAQKDLRDAFWSRHTAKQLREQAGR